jgi:hypothetical protein
MAGPSDTLRSPWPPLAIRPCTKQSLLIKAVVHLPAVEYKVECDEEEIADYRFCHSAVEYEEAGGQTTALICLEQSRLLNF